MAAAFVSDGVFQHKRQLTATTKIFKSDKIQEHIYTSEDIIQRKFSLHSLNKKYFPSQISNDFSFPYNGLMCKNEPENWV